MAVPTMNALKDAGIDAKGLFGQWDHDYPDRPVQLDDRSDLGGRGGEAFPEMIRYDWMQDLLEWFDFYLRDVGEQPGLYIEIQSNQGSWRLEDRYPPSDTVEITFDLGGSMENIGGGTTVFPDANTGPVWQSAPLSETMYVAGTPRLHVDVTTASVGGQLYALLEECDDSDNCIHIGHAIMDLRYHAGGDDIQSWTPVVETINAKMEFMPLDAEILEGHTLRLSLLSTGEDYLPASTSSVVFVQEGESSTLQMDTFVPADKIYFTPPECLHERCVTAE
jgi:predicted acyl esterase